MFVGRVFGKAAGRQINYRTPAVQPRFAFFWRRKHNQDCFSKLNVKSTASVEEIESAFNAELRRLQSQQRTMQQQREIDSLRQAYGEAMMKAEEKQESQHQDSTSSSFQDLRQQQKPKGFFRTIIDNADYGRKATKEEKSWGWEIGAFAIISVTAVCYALGQYLKEQVSTKAEQNQPGIRVILTHKDLQEAKTLYAQRAEFINQQRRLEEERRQAEKERAESNAANINNGNSYEDSGVISRMNLPGDDQKQKSSFEKEFEEYQKKGSWGGGKDE